MGDAPDLWTLADLCTPWCVHVAVTLRVAEHLTSGLDEVDDLARAAGCDAGLLARLLRHLVRRGLFEEPAPGRFALNDAARGLLDPGLRLGLDLDGLGGRFAHAWTGLLELVRAGAPVAYEARFGRPFWEDLDAHPALRAQFDDLMGPAGHGPPDPRVLLGDPDADWSKIRTVVDVGGADGALLAAILRAHPGVEGVLVDRPSAIERAPAVFAAAGVADRARGIGQSFLDPLPDGADLYVLMKVLNDFTDRDKVPILRRCAEAARPSRGRVVVCGGVTPDDEPPGLSIEAVLVGGVNADLSTFRGLAREAGLEVTAAGRRADGRFAVECRPV
jgi:hypothetical protein